MSEPTPAPPCAHCGKPEAYCVCAAIAPVATRTAVVILQHPQEKAELLGTAQLAALQVEKSLLQIGLSWSNLKRILDRDVDLKRWAVLYLGAAKNAPRESAPVLELVTPKGERLPDHDQVLRSLQGIIALDGTWSQAKTLWWRNPWLLKCRRLVLNPPFRSRYGHLRREPRHQSLSTLEAIALTLSQLEKDEGLYPRLVQPFEALVEKVQRRK